MIMVCICLNDFFIFCRILEGIFWKCICWFEWVIGKWKIECKVLLFILKVEIFVGVYININGRILYLVFYLFVVYLG